MKNTLRTLGIIGVLGIMGITVNAITPEQIELDNKVHNQMKKQVLGATPAQYSHELLYKDIYGNILFVDWFEQRTCYLYEVYDKPIKQYIGASREGYETSHENFDLGLNNNYSKEVVLVPLAPATTTEGYITLPTQNPVIGNRENLDSYAKIERIEGEKPIQEAYIKINEDGSFKIDNLKEGIYKVTPVMLSNKSVQPSEEFTLPSNTIEIKHGEKVQLDYSEQIYQVDARVGISDYFTLPYYEYPEWYLTITDQLVLPDTVKKDIDKKINNEKNLSTIEGILKYIKNNYSEPKKDAVKDRMATASEIIQQGGCIGCTNYATLFQAIAKYKGIPCIVVDATSTKHIEKMRKEGSDWVIGHVLVECYIDGKWILVDSTNGDIYLDYDVENFRLDSTSSPYDDDMLYIYYKAPDLSYMDVDNISRVQTMYDNVFDLSLTNEKEQNKPSKNFLR